MISLLSVYQQNSNLSAQDHENIIVVSVKFSAALDEYQPRARS